MKEVPTLSVVIPLFREGPHLRQCLQEIKKHLDQLGKSYEFVLVDDGSPDDTWEAIRSFAREYDNVQGISFSRNFGKEAAMRAGLEYARGRATIVMDGDLQHPPKLISEMIRLWEEEGYDVVDATKASRGHETFWYKLSAGFFTRMVCRLSGFNLAGASDFKLLDRKVVNELLRFTETRTFYRGMTEWLGFKHARLPMHVEDRAYGLSGWSFFRMVRFAVTALTSFSAVLLHGMTLLGLLFVLFAIILCVYTIYIWLTHGALEGFTTVILLQLLIGGIIMLGQGVMGEYLATVYWETKRRPRYIIKASVSERQPETMHPKPGKETVEVT